MSKIRVLSRVRVLGTPSYKLSALLLGLAAGVGTRLIGSTMPKKNPLRRLSVALRLSEAYQPPQVANTILNEASLSTFLSSAKASYLKDLKEDAAKGANWTVVMGNEAGGTSFGAILHRSALT